MFKVGDVVRVKDSITLWQKYWIVECLEEHTETKGMIWEIEQVFGEGQWYILSMSPGITFDESMFELVESTAHRTDEQNKFMDDERQKRVDERREVARKTLVEKWYMESRRVIVHKRLEEYQKMINKLEEVDRDMFFWMLYDKLESILYEEYWE